MTLEEAIAHCEEKALGTSECAAEHKQLAEWLEELRSRNASLKEYFQAGYEAGKAMKLKKIKDIYRTYYDALSLTARRPAKTQELYQAGNRAINQAYQAGKGERVSEYYRGGGVTPMYCFPAPEGVNDLTGLSKRRIVMIDDCLAEEVMHLWMAGIWTIGSCCGHGGGHSFIQVDPDSVPKMLELGYTKIPERPNGQGAWCFEPHSTCNCKKDTYKTMFDCGAEVVEEDR